MKDMILLVLSSLMILITVSSCDETELIDPQSQRTGLNTGAGDGVNNDNNGNTSIDGTYNLNANNTIEDEDSDMTGDGLFDLDANSIDAANIGLTVAGGNKTTANYTIDPNDDLRSTYGTASTPLTANPADAASDATTRTYYSSGGTWDHKRPREEDRVQSTMGATGSNGLTPVMPEDVEARDKRSRMSRMK